jgi:hypothetical protein
MSQPSRVRIAVRGYELDVQGTTPDDPSGNHHPCDGTRRRRHRLNGGGRTTHGVFKSDAAAQGTGGYRTRDPVH